MEEYKVLITTSGIGSRLGNLTNNTNKALIRIGKKPAISYIVELYPDEVELVITLGYFGEQVEDFLRLAYPQKKFTFINVEKYDGEGSSLGYSMLQAKEHLQCPFIFHASDTLLINGINVPKPFTDWLGGSNGKDSSQYRTLSTKNIGMIINEKGSMDFEYIYIGLAGIFSYENFWENLTNEFNKNSSSQSISDCDGLRYILNKELFIVDDNNWLDIGNTTELKKSRENIPDKFEILDKEDESIFLFDEFVIKFFADKNICLNRVKRNEVLEGLVPELLEYTDNFYKYKYAKGTLLSEIIDENIMVKLLNYCKNNLWVNKKNDNSFKEKCLDFYLTKTNKRVNEYLERNNLKDSCAVINGFIIPSLSEMLTRNNLNLLFNDSSYNFHGDLICDNIIYNNGEFTLIDWRQDFGGSLTDGDIYYDLAKLSHNLFFNHSIVNRGLFTIEKNNTNITCDILISNTLLNCQKVLENFIIENGFDIKKVYILRAIIWLNMSPLHYDKLGEFLFNFGKFNLFKALYLN